MTLDKDDIAALTVLLARQIKAQDEKAEAEAARKLADEQLADANKRMANCRSAFAAFGFDITENGLWDVVKGAMGTEAWNMGFLRARSSSSEETTQPEKGAGTAHATGDEDLDEQKTDRAIPLTPPDKPSEETEGRGKQPVRVLVLKYLSEAGERGMKAAELRALVEESQGIQLHNKTIGMTLYRLSLDDLAWRVKRTWFSVPPPVEAEKSHSDTSVDVGGK